MEQIKADAFFYEWNPENTPIRRVHSGDRLVIEAKDCFSELLTEKNGWEVTKGEVDVTRLNPLTGPIWVEDAMAGDVLAVTVEKIELYPWTVVANRAQCGILGDQFAETTYKYMKIEDGQIRFDDRLRIPVRPMVGVIGVTPKEPISTRKMGDWGGNMDNNKITEGATLYLPIQVEGALFALGDIHACMGDGEINGSAMESGGYVTIKVKLRKGIDLKRPAVLDNDFFYTTATAPDPMTGFRLACEDMLDILEKKTGMERTVLSMLMSGVGDAQVCVSCSPDVQTVRFAMPRQILEKYVADLEL